MINKIKRIIFDFDGVVGSSGDVICTLYNLMYPYHPEFKEAKFSECIKWSMTDICPLLTEDQVEELFASSEFWDYFVMFDGMEKLIHELYDLGLDIIFVSRGTTENIRHKISYINKHFPYATQIPLVGHWRKSISKGLIDMSNSIFVDDVDKNLNDSNSPHKILFNEHGNFDLEWNRNFDGNKVGSVDSLRELIYTILEEVK